MRATAAGFADRGVRPGDRVAILGANSVDWVVAFWAAVYAGAIVVAGNAWWTSREIDYRARADCAPRLVLADAERATRVSGHAYPDRHSTRCRTHVRTPDVARDQDDPAVIMYTSGTTGHPKGAVHSHRNLLAIIEYHRLGDAIQRELATRFGLPLGQRRFLMSLPLFHIASLHNLAIPRLTSGDTVVIDSGRFDADRVLGVDRARAHHELGRRADHGASPRRSGHLALRPVLAVGAERELRTVLPCVEGPAAHGAPRHHHGLADSYGLTEIGTAATVASSADLATYPTSVGAPIPDRAARDP